MARSKKKAKAKKKVKAKAKKKVTPKKNFAARAKMAGVLCLNVREGTACVVKRLTADVKEAADSGQIIAVVLKTNQIITNGETINAKEQRFDQFMGTAVAAPVVAKAAPVVADEPVEAVEAPISHANGHDRSAAVEQPSA